jgi:maltose/moltooligosaccharide transporter
MSLAKPQLSFWQIINPATAISFAGILLLLAALATMRIKKDRISNDVTILSGSSHSSK